MITPFAVGMGGAIFNAGAWAINNTVFSENTAGRGGLAIHDDGSFLGLSNATFRGNMFTCPSDQYSDAHHVRKLRTWYRFLVHSRLVSPLEGTKDGRQRLCIFAAKDDPDSLYVDVSVLSGMARHRNVYANTYSVRVDTLCLLSLLPQVMLLPLPVIHYT